MTNCSPKPFLIFTICLLLCSCGVNRTEQVENNSIKEYPDHVGDIAPDPKLDNPQFKTCEKGRIPQYYALGAEYRVPNKKLMDHFGTTDLSDITDTGFYTIRFIVNCEGQVGRLREQSMDSNYQEIQLAKNLKEAIRNKLLSFDQWPKGRDFYQYLTFKIEQGQIKEVLP